MKKLIIISMTFILFLTSITAVNAGVTITEGDYIGMNNTLINISIKQNAGVIQYLYDTQGNNWLWGSDEPWYENAGWVKIYGQSTGWHWSLGTTDKICYVNNTDNSWRGPVWSTVACVSTTDPTQIQTYTMRSGAGFVDSRTNVPDTDTMGLEMRELGAGGSSAGYDVIRLPNTAGTEFQITYPGDLHGQAIDDLERNYVNLLDYGYSGQHMQLIWNSTNAVHPSSIYLVDRHDIGGAVYPYSNNQDDYYYNGITTPTEFGSRIILYDNTSATGDDDAAKYGLYWNDTDPSYITDDMGSCSFNPKGFGNFSVFGDVVYCQPSSGALKTKLSLNSNITTAWLMVKPFTFIDGMTIYAYNSSSSYPTSELCWALTNESGSWDYAGGNCAGADTNVTWDASNSPNLAQPIVKDGLVYLFAVIQPQSDYYLILNTTCTVPYEDMFIGSDTSLCSGDYYLNDSNQNGVLFVMGSNFVLDCNNAHFIGNTSAWDAYANPFLSMGIEAYSVQDVTIKNCHFSNYHVGIWIGIGNDNIIKNNEFDNSYAGFWGDSWQYDGMGINDTIIESNYIHDNFLGVGFGQRGYSSNNIIRNNQVIDNYWGIRVGGWFPPMFGGMTEAYNTEIYGNNITTDNSKKVIDTGSYENEGDVMIATTNSFNTAIYNNIGVGNYTLLFNGNATNVNITNNTFDTQTGYLFDTNDTIENVNVSCNNIVIVNNESIWDDNEPILINVDYLSNYCPWVGPYISATFNYDAVAYAVSAGDSDVAAPDQDLGNYNVTMDTNANYAVTASGTDFTGATSNFYIGNLKMDAKNVYDSFNPVTSVALSNDPQEIATGLTPADTMNYHGYWLSVPAAQFGESYTSTLTISYANV
jgi:parallel beta-helix repeat protein